MNLEYKNKIIEIFDDLKIQIIETHQSPLSLNLVISTPHLTEAILTLHRFLTNNW